MKPLRWWALLMLLSAGLVRAQVPGTDEMAAAFRAAEPQARLAGLVTKLLVEPVSGAPLTVLLTHSRTWPTSA